MSSPITSTSPASDYVGIDQSITFGSPDGQTILPLTSGITDTGTTLILIATGECFSVHCYSDVLNAITSAQTHSNSTRLLRAPCPTLTPAFSA